MIQHKEKLELDIFDHDGNKLCDLYSSKSETAGQAYNVIIMKQRNGWKELTFDQPGKIKGDVGDEDNYRVEYIVADYKIRAIDDEETDWYLMTEPQIKHVNGTKVLSVKAGHVCQLLKTKNLSLEFSDDEGNNTGTQEEQATTILDGTGWSVGNCDEFYEDYTDNAGNNIVKRRSLTASAKTGAFSQISKACEQFRAKPTYHGDTKTVDFKPLNPFSEDKDGGVPEAVTNDQVFELHYGHALKGVTRTLNTENLITRLYVQGAFKDKVSGYCGINEVKNKEYTYTFVPPTGQTGFPAGQEFKITFKDDIKKKNVRYFVCNEEITGNAKFVYSLRDPASMMFVLGTYTHEYESGDIVGATERTNVVLRVTKKNTTGSFVSTTKTKKRDKKSLMDSLMDFTYYDSVNLLNDEKLEKIAQYYIEAPGLLQIVNEKMTDYSEAMQKLNETVGVINYCKLNVTSTNNDNGYAKLILGPDSNDYGNGVIYRTDYEAKANKRFKWRNATKLKSNGDPVDLTASVVYVIHPKQQGQTITWDKYYVKNIFNDNVIKETGTWTQVSNNTIELNPSDGSEPITVTYSAGTATCSVTEEDQNITLSPSHTMTGSEHFTSGGYSLYAYNNSKDLGCHVNIRSVDYGTYSITFDYNANTKNAVVDQENISSITLWADNSEFALNSNDEVFLFETYNLNGLLGALEASDEATMQSLEAATKGITVNHPVYFGKEKVSTSTLPQDELDALHGYGWRWRYYPNNKTKGILYFCYPTENDNSWHRVWYSNGNLQPRGLVQNRDYWYNWAEKIQSRCYRASGSNGKWVLLESTDEKRVAEMFGTVYNACWTRDQYYKGIYDYTVYTVPENSTMPIGNYALYNGYHKYWLFTTQRNLVAGDTLTYDSKLDVVNERKPGTADKVLEVKSMRPDAAKYHSPNIAANIIWEDGIIHNTGEHAGEDADSTEFERCGFIAVQPKTTYTVNYTPPSGENAVSLTVLRYDENRKYIDSTQCGPGNTFNTNSTTRQETVEEETITVEVLTKYIRVTHAKQAIENFKIQAVDFDQYLLVDDESYKIIGKDDDEANISYPDTVDEKENREKGIMKLIEKFKDQSYDVYEVCLPAVKAAQANQNALEDDLKDTLGDLYREGFWEDDNYTDGDEHRQYVDGVDNLIELAKPEAKYNINYAHLRGSQVDNDYWSADFTKRGEWPRITIDSAAHLIDPELDINIWAFVDKVATCYDQPWKTNIEINTDQSTISQHSFSDVMTNIADVASKVKAKQSIYSRASSIGQGGVLDTDFLEGKINANKLLIEGGSSTWRTNSRGNMIFENVDGGSAMTLTGNGFAIANSKDQDGDWNWRTKPTIGSRRSNAE